MYSMASLGRTHPAASNDRNLHGVRALIHHAQNDGLGRRPRQSPHDSAQPRTARMNVDRHGEHGIGHHQCIGAARLGRACQHGDVADVGRELRPHRQRGRTLHGSDHLFGGFRIHGKGIAIFFEVGARNVRFDGLDAGHRNACRELAELLYRIGRDAGHQRRRELPVKRHQRLDVMDRPLAGNADGPQHGIFEFRNARRRIAFTDIRRDGLGDEGAQAVDVEHARQLLAEGSRARHDRILECQGSDLHAQVYHERVSRTSNTGPSQHTRR